MKGKKSTGYGISTLLTLAMISGSFVGVNAQQEVFNNGNRFVRWRMNNSLVFSVLNDEASPGNRVVLADHNPDTIGKKWRYEDQMIKGLNDLCLDVDANSDIILNDCGSAQAKWNFDEFGRAVATIDQGNGLMGLGCAQGSIEGELIPLTLRDCVTASTQSFELEGTGTTASFMELEQMVMGGDSVNTTIVDDMLESDGGDSQVELESGSEFSANAGNANIVTVLAGQENTSLLTSALAQSNLINIIANTDNLTLFAPTDEAFRSIDSRILAQLLQEENAELLEELLLFHVLPEGLDADQVLSTTSLPTLLGEELSVEPRAASLNGVGDSVFEVLDLNTENDGVVHVINTVLIPQSVSDKLENLNDNNSSELDSQVDDSELNSNDSTVVEEVDEEEVEAEDISSVTDDIEVIDGEEEIIETDDGVFVPGDSNEIIENEEDADDDTDNTISDNTEIVRSTTFLSSLVNREDTSILTNLLVDLELDEVLSTEESFSIFAPTDAAFEALDPAVLEFLQQPENSPILEELLLNHVVPEKLVSSEVLSASELATINGLEIAIDPSLTFVEVDIESDDQGIVHVIDSVLVPEGLIEGVNLEDVISSDTSVEVQDSSEDDQITVDSMPSPIVELPGSNSTPSRVTNDSPVINSQSTATNQEGDAEESSAAVSINSSPSSSSSTTTTETEVLTDESEDNGLVIAETDEVGENITQGVDQITSDEASVSIESPSAVSEESDDNLTQESESDVVQSGSFEDFVPITSSQITGDEVEDSEVISVTTEESLLMEEGVIVDSLDSADGLLLQDPIMTEEDDLDIDIVSGGGSVNFVPRSENRVSTSLSPTEAYEFELLFPTQNVEINGLQRFQALLRGVDPAEYDAFWQVESGQLNEMENTGNGKASFVSVENWNWKEHGPYLITVSAFLDDELVAQESVDIFVP